MHKYLILLPILLLAGCFKPGTVQQPDDAQADFKVKHLFTVDGCKVYRFTDYGARYFVTCQGSTSQRIPQGKSSRDEEIPTDG